MQPRLLITLVEDANNPQKLKQVNVSVRVGQAVDVVAQAGRPKTITGFQTHTTPVLLAYGERAELANDECELRDRAFRVYARFALAFRYTCYAVPRGSRYSQKESRRAVDKIIYCGRVVACKTSAKKETCFLLIVEQLCVFACM